jgi:phosphoglycerate dehydrogenase-like enzyme
MQMERIERIHAYVPWGDFLRERLEPAVPDRELVVWEREEEFVEGIGEAEVLFVLRPPRGHWAGARRLRLIQTTGAGVDAVLPAPDLSEDVLITNARGVHARHMSEFGIALLLAIAKRIPRAVQHQREHRWQMFRPRQLDGATLGILGLGSIGEAVAQRGRALGMRVIGTRRSGEPSPHADRVYSPAETDEVLAQSDAIVVLLPLTPETRGFLDRDRIARMKPGALLVNLARGGIVDEGALADALKEERIAGAAMDVFEEEPLPSESLLWDVPNLLVTPHMAGLVDDYIERVVAIFAENLGHLERGEPLVNRVDRARGY